MTDEVPQPLPDPGPDVPEKEKIPGTWIEGYNQFREEMNTFRDRVRTMFLLLGLAFVTIGVTAVILVHRTDSNSRSIQAQELRDKRVFCAAIEKSKTDAIATHKPIDPQTDKFEHDYGCFTLLHQPGAVR